MQTATELARSAFESFTDRAVALLDSAGKVVLWGAGAARLTGIPADRTLGRDFATFGTSPAPSLPGPGERTRGEISLPTEGGRATLYSIELSALPGPGVSVAGFVALLEAGDRPQVTDPQYRADVRALFQHSPDFVSAFGPDLRHLWVNRTVERDTGLPATSFVGKSNRELGMPGELITLWEAKLREAFASAGPVVLEFEYAGPGGARAYSSRLYPDVGPDGTVAAVLCIATDVTESRRAAEALRRSERQFRLLAENARDAIFRYFVHPYPKYEYVSPSIWDITGYSPEQFYADPNLIRRITHPDDRGRLDAYLAGDFPSADYLEIRFVANDGRKVYTEQRVVKIRDAAGKVVGFEGIVRDVSERKRAKRELQAAKDAAEAALKEVRQLRGLLPICSYCKKVQDKEAFWHQVEEYVAKHTEAQFSHGICPDCYERVIVPELEQLKRDPGL